MLYLDSPTSPPPVTGIPLPGLSEMQTDDPAPTAVSENQLNDSDLLQLALQMEDLLSRNLVPVSDPAPGSVSGLSLNIPSNPGSVTPTNVDVPSSTAPKPGARRGPSTSAAKERKRGRPRASTNVNTGFTSTGVRSGTDDAIGDMGTQIPISTVTQDWSPAAGAGMQLGFTGNPSVKRKRSLTTEPEDYTGKVVGMSEPLAKHTNVPKSQGNPRITLRVPGMTSKTKMETQGMSGWVCI